MIIILDFALCEMGGKGGLPALREVGGPVQNTSPLKDLQLLWTEETFKFFLFFAKLFLDLRKRVYYPY